MKLRKKSTPKYNYGVGNRLPSPVGTTLITKGSHAKSCDVNEIVKKFDRTGVLTHLQQAEGIFADVSAIGSYQDAVQNVQRAQEHFLELPPGLRDEFANDPAQYLDWALTASQEDKEALYASITGEDRYASSQEPTEAPSPSSPPGEAPPE